MPAITTGTTVTFASGYLGTILTLARGGKSRGVLDRSHFGTTGVRVKAPTSLQEPGTLSGTMQFDPTAAPPLGDAAETVTITFPDTTTWAASGFMITHDNAGNLEEDYEVSFEIQLSGADTIT